MFNLRRDEMRELGEFMPAENHEQAVLASLWAQAIDFDRVGLDDDFFALGGTSIQAARLFDCIEREFGITLPLATLYNAPTVRALAEEIAAAIEPAHSVAAPAATDLKRLVPIRTGGSRPPLLVSAGIGGGVVGLGHLANALNPDQPIYGLESRGLDGKQEPLFDIGDIAAEYLDEIALLQPEGPVHLFGICWGALLVLELASRLEAAGRKVGMVAMLDPPPIRGKRGVVGRPMVESALALPRFVASRLGLYWHNLTRLPREQRREYLRERLNVIRDIAHERKLFRGNNSELWRRKVRQANLVAARTYQPARYDGPVNLLFTTERPDGRSRAGRDDWIRHLNVDTDVVHVPGRDTSEAMSADFVQHVTTILSPHLSNPQ